MRATRSRPASGAAGGAGAAPAGTTPAKAAAAAAAAEGGSKRPASRGDLRGSAVDQSGGSAEPPPLASEQQQPPAPASALRRERGCADEPVAEAAAVAAPAPAPAEATTDPAANHPLGRVNSVVNNGPPVTEAEVAHALAPEAAVEEEARLQREREEQAAAAAAAQEDPAARDLSAARFQQLDKLLDKAGLYTQFLTEQMRAMHEEGDGVGEAAAVEEEADDDDAAAAAGSKRKKKGAAVAAAAAAGKRARGAGALAAAAAAAAAASAKDSGKGGNKGAAGKASASAAACVKPFDARTATRALCPLVEGELRDYQLKGVRWMVSLWQNGLNGILADQMGLGKTVQTVAFLSHLRSKGIDGPFLVIGPLSTLPNWTSEVKRWCPSMDALLYHGSRDERAALRVSRLDAHVERESGGGGAAATAAGGGVKPTFPVVVTSFEIVMADSRLLGRYRWKYVIVDEGHRLKNSGCRLLRELKMIPAENKLLLTGTPLQNNLAELWSLLNFLLPDIFGSLADFESWFDFSGAVAATGGQGEGMTAAAGAAAEAAAERAEKRAAEAAEGQAGGSGAQAGGDGSGGGEAAANAAANTSNPAAASAAAASAAAASAAAASEIVAAEQRNRVVSKLHALLRPFMLRRIKADVELDLPRKLELLLYAPMLPAQRKLNAQLLAGSFDKELRAMAEAAGGRAPAAASAAKLNNVLMQMRKNCNHPDLITGGLDGSVTFPPPEQLRAECGKLALLERVLSKLRARDRGHKVLIFSQMTRMLDLLDAYFDAQGERPLRLDGGVPWQQRQEAIRAFNDKAGESWLFLLSTRAGGLGINLTAADTVIIYDSDWNPHQDLQAMDRCHRIGQTRPVLVLRLATAHSVEGAMLRRAASKRALERVVIKRGAFKEVVDDPSAGGAGGASASSLGLSAQELAQMLRQDYAMDDVPQSGACGDAALDALLDRAHLLGPADAPLPFPAQGVGYEVVQQMDATGLES